jgi:tetratricopeptide (TPR) repeat protein
MNRMKKLVLILICTIGSMAAPIFSQTLVSTRMDSLIAAGMDMIFRTEYDSAWKTFDRIFRIEPDSSIGLFYQAACLQSKMMDFETDRWEDDFFRVVNRAIRLGEKRIESGLADAGTYFHLGNTYSYRGFFLAKTGKVVAGFVQARKGGDALEKAVGMDSTFADAYLGIGNYKYWSGRFTQTYMGWLPWLKDERDLGISLMHRAIDRGRFSRWAGMNSLGWIEYDRKQYTEALDIFLAGLEKYPKSRFFLWGAADCSYRMKDWETAASFYEPLCESILSAGMDNLFNEIVCRSRLVECWFHLGRNDQALHQADFVLSMKPDKKTAKRTKEFRSVVERIREDLVKHEFHGAGYKDL